MREIGRTKLNDAQRCLRELFGADDCPRVVRDGQTARIEAGENDFIAILMRRDVIVPALLDANFQRVTLDLEGKAAARKHEEPSRN